MNWFKNSRTKAEAQRCFRSLSKIYHPDAGNEPDGELFAEINNQYKAKLQELKNPKKKHQKTPKEHSKNTRKNTRTEQDTEQVAEYEPKKPRFTDKQKKHLVKGASLLFNVFADKFVDRLD